MSQPASSRPGLEIDLFLRRSPSFALELELEIAPGRTAALLGPNGAGKSTLVQALAGHLPIDSGRIVLGGRTLDDPDAAIFVPPEQREIGVVYQDALLFPHLSVLENVAFGPRCRPELGRRAARDRAMGWLRHLSIEDLAARKPRQLSGGQAQRVALARSLASEPGLLLLDEPLSALDVGGRARLRTLLSEHLADFEGPRLLITHDPTEAFLLADEIHILEEGRLVQSGSAEEIRLRPRSRYAAELAGANLLVGQSAEGVVTVDGHALQIADRQLTGPVLVTIRPTAISLHRRRPEGSSQRNAWRTTIRQIEPLGDRLRLLTGPPLALTVEITPEAARALDLAEGRPIWLALKATDIGLAEDDGTVAVESKQGQISSST